MNDSYQSNRATVPSASLFFIMPTFVYIIKIEFEL